MENKITSTKRIFKAGWLNFLRNRTVSISSTAILTTTLLIIGIFFFFRGIFDYTLMQIRDKVDIKVYFKLDATDEQIINIKNKITTIPEVKSADLTTADEALEQFKENHIDDQITLQALDELNGNPFGAMLTVTAQDTGSYDSIAKSLDSGSQFLGDSYSIIDKVNYYELKSSIDKLNNIVKWVDTIGYWITFIFIIISSLIIFNTIRLSIFVHKDEIGVMKLVGASNMYIRGPFLIESTLYAILSSILSMIAFLPITYYLAKKTTLFFSGLNIYKYYLDNFFSLFILLFIISIVLSTISSILAIRKYLKI